MKHSDYQAKIDEIKTLECCELKRAVSAHGGFYEWSEENGGCPPIIAINSDNSEPEPQDVEITKVAVIDNCLEISGIDKGTGEPIEFDIDDIFPGHLSFIIDYIPETDEVSDASQPASTNGFAINAGIGERNEE